jgi:hypothetical protein
LERHTERYIEEELKLYPIFKKAVTELEQEYIDILHRGRQFTTIPGTSSKDDKVSRAVIRMREIESESADKQKRVERIERGLAILTSLERQYVKVAYFEFNEFTTYETIMQQLHIGNRNKLSRIKRDTLYKFAIVFNLV